MTTDQSSPCTYHGYTPKQIVSLKLDLGTKQVVNIDFHCWIDTIYSVNSILKITPAPYKYTMGQYCLEPIGGRGFLQFEA